MKTHLRPIFLSLILLLGASEGVRLWWYRAPTGPGVERETLRWNVPEDAIDRRFSETRGGKVLGYDTGTQVLLGDKETPVTTEVTYLEYEEGNDRVLTDLYLHSPEVCFPASGIQLVSGLPSRTFVVEGRELLVRQWLFRDPVSGAPLHAFKVIWSSDDHELRQTLYSGDLKKARLRAVLDRRELASAKMILAVIAGVQTSQDSWAVFENRVLSNLSLDRPSPKK